MLILLINIQSSKSTFYCVIKGVKRNLEENELGRHYGIKSLTRILNKEKQITTLIKAITENEEAHSNVGTVEVKIIRL
ncbi:hypothetical protein BpHYR1_034625 [Brachionus plicatilis]|uniref:Uncharacterized protein n=1 Tax=Brachionus plicatilis TaxID=10195 RepID=A0A3M7T458_BRAPC|nr:hypothetical protein BpHYR1_034625 [Brachionus plicatilis]